MLTVTTAATDLQLLTIAEMREAAGVVDDSRDAALAAMGLKIAAAIAAECKIAVGDGGQPTLKRETLRETLRKVDADCVFLSRRHNITVSSVVADGVTLPTTDYEISGESGKLIRLSNDEPVDWGVTKLVVTYDAGFSEAPADLKMAAADFMRLAWLEKSRDPSLKSEETDIDGIQRTKRDYWVGAVPGGSGGEGAVPVVVSGQLQRYRNIV